MNVLDLSLTYHWYDEIEAGRKTEEYRDKTDYYTINQRRCGRVKLTQLEVEYLSDLLE